MCLACIANSIYNFSAWLGLTGITVYTLEQKVSKQSELTPHYRKDYSCLSVMGGH